MKREVTKTFKFYLGGAISHAKGTLWIEWRADMAKFLASIGQIAIDPTLKHRVPLREKMKIGRMIEFDQVDVAREYIRKRIMLPDHQLMDQSDANIAMIDVYSIGTSAELEYFYVQGKPNYIVTNLPRSKWSAWFVGLSTLIFASMDDLKEFLKKMED